MQVQLLNKNSFIQYQAERFLKRIPKKQNFMQLLNKNSFVQYQGRSRLFFKKTFYKQIYLLLRRNISDLSKIQETSVCNC